MVNFVGIISALDAIATGRYKEFKPDLYERLKYNGRRVSDLLMIGGTLALPGVSPARTDILVNYDKPLLKKDGVIVDIGDLEGTEAQDTLQLDGLFQIPIPGALDESGHLVVGAPARFIVAEDPEGKRIRFHFVGRPPE